MLPTPDTDHLNFANIYEPSEDSYLFLDTLSSQTETTYLASHFPSADPSPLVLEIGPGSGIILAFLAVNATTIFGRPDVLTLGVDVNLFACRGTRETLARGLDQVSPTDQKAVYLSSIAGSLSSALRQGTVDVLLFNPPYVPSESVPPTDSIAGASIFERDNAMLALATDGGADGMEITNRLMEEIPHVLSPRGLAYVLLCAQNKPARVVERIREWKGRGLGTWDVDVVGNSGKTGGWEKLVIIRIARSSK